MGETHSPSVSSLLQDLRAGRRAAFDELLPLLYEELLHVAACQRRRWEGDETLDTTGLVHEAYLRLVDQSAPDWRNQAHFLAVAATAMRQILIDYAKRRRAAKRGGGARHYVFHDIQVGLRSPYEASDEATKRVVRPHPPVAGRDWPHRTRC
jgi:RNA polymerase sigma factor (TIGR02999 family)